VVAEAPSLAAAARQLDVDVTTLHRWFREGKLTRPTPRPRRPLPLAPAAEPGVLSAVSWAAAVRGRYDLDATEEVLVELAEGALALAQDVALRPADRLAAMSRFAALARQINFEAPDNGQTQINATTTAARPFPRRVG